MAFDVCSQITSKMHEGKVRFQIGDVSTNWMEDNDFFIERISQSNINPLFLKKHVIKEIEIKNTLDRGIDFLKSAKYSRAVECFDEVLFYDDEYAEALINKSFCFKAQKHFVKSLRYYKKAINVDVRLKDGDYYKKLLGQANDERSNFSKLKLNIYAGDEHFSKGEFEKALASYNRALINPSKFKDKILDKLLNKKGTALIKLNRFDEALVCFKKSRENDYARFGQGICEYELGLEVNEKFRALLLIDKSRMLKQVLILNELGFFDESLIICDYLMENHFKVDEFYRNLLDAKRHALLSLDEDFSDIDEIISKLFS